MKLLPLELAARRGTWQRYYYRKQQKSFLAVQKKIWARDNYTCRYCGFQSQRYQQVINYDFDYDNNKAGNLVTACEFCTQCFFLDGFAMSDDFGGSIILMPNISQSDLNNFCRALFCSMAKDTPYKSRLQQVYLSLKDLAKPVENALGPETSNPAIFGEALMDCGLKPNEISLKTLAQLRLLPKRSKFKEQVEYWNATSYSKFPL